MSEVAQKKVEQSPAAEVKKTKADNVIGRKLASVIFVMIAFVLVYFSLGTGSETMMWAGLGVVVLSQILMYMRF